jgi:hypothetical protein
VLLKALDRVWDPNFNTTLRDLWDRRQGYVEGFRAGTDYLPFQTIAGTSSIDVKFSGPRYPCHSSYNNFDFVERIMDPDFQYHGLMAQVAGLLVLELADRWIMPFDMVAYGNALQLWARELDSWIKNHGATQQGNPSLDIQTLNDAINEVKAAASDFEKWEMTWDTVVLSSGNWESNEMGAKRHEYNDMMARFDTNLLDLTPGGGVRFPCLTTLSFCPMDLR